MFKPSRTLSLMLSACAVLAACGGGANTANDAEVIALLSASNINYSQYNQGGSNAGTKRWVGNAGAAPQIQVYIPAPAPGDATQADLATKARTAISTLNRRLAGELSLVEVSTEPATPGHLRVSYLTAYVPGGSTNYSGFCANVSTGALAGNVVAPDPATGSFNATTPWINLGNGHCDVTQDVVIHEFGHALGLGAHFNGFGDGDSISPAFWDALATLYGNAVQTLATKLVVVRAAN